MIVKLFGRVKRSVERQVQGAKALDSAAEGGLIFIEIGGLPRCWCRGQTCINDYERVYGGRQVARW